MMPRMSRAFIRERDDAPEPPLPRRRIAAVPTGPVIEPARDGPADQVRLGSVVVVRDADGESTYQIVAPEAADPARGEISWLAPLAQALLHRRAGDRVRFRDEELHVLRVTNS